jgi:hypothetical protein
MRWMGQAICTKEIPQAYNILFVKPDGNRTPREAAVKK